MRRFITVLLLFVATFCLAGCARKATAVCPVTIHDLNMLWVDGAWRGCSAASDGNIYLGLCSHALEHSAAVARYEPAAKRFAGLGDMAREAKSPIGLDGFVPQGKIHTPFIEDTGTLYFATHVGAVTEKILSRRKPYPGGRFMALDMETKRFRIVGQAPEKEGIVTLAADFERGRLFGLTFPSSLMLVCDLKTGTVTNIGPTEAVWHEAKGREKWQNTCRYLGVDPDTGRVFGTREDGTVYYLDPKTMKLVVTELSVRDGIVGEADEEARALSQWRTIRYDPTDKCFYGLQQKTASLFRFDPRAMTIAPIARMTPTALLDAAKPTRSARLGFILTADRVIYHIAFGPGVDIEGRKKARNQCYLVSYDLKTNTYRDHGPLIESAEAGRRVIWNDSLTLGADGSLYAFANVEVLDPFKEWQLATFRRGEGSYTGVAGVRFEMAVVEIPADVLK